ncbi:MAG: hypothetical protein WC628_04240 [Candidatus Omnitrophota bacterium]
MTWERKLCADWKARNCEDSAQEKMFMAILHNPWGNYDSINEAKPNTKAKCIKSNPKRLKLSEEYSTNLLMEIASIK